MGTDLPALDRLVEELQSRTVIVEGRKDARALRELGVQDVVPINGQPLDALARRMRTGGEVVILTDFDAEGKRLHARLHVLLQARRIPANKRLRHMMRALGKTRIEDFRRAAPSVNKEGDSHGEACASVDQVRREGNHQGKGHR